MASVNLMTQEIDGHRYGIGRCVVSIGQAGLEAVAVSYDDEKWASTEADCIAWLVRHGLPRRQAERFVVLGLKAWDESHSIGIA